MSRRKRSAQQDIDRTSHWLGADGDARSRRWAYEELLVRRDRPGVAEGELAALEAQLADDLAQLERMHAELSRQLTKVATALGRVQALGGTGEPAEVAPELEPPSRAEMRAFPSLPSAPRSAERRSVLSRCEGFRVDSASGFFGYVEGLRFVSRIDEPDFLEVSCGRFGRELALVPVDAVEEVSLAEERLVVSAVGAVEEQHEALVERLRRMLHHPAT